MLKQFLNHGSKRKIHDVGKPRDLASKVRSNDQGEAAGYTITPCTNENDDPHELVASGIHGIGGANLGLHRRRARFFANTEPSSSRSRADTPGDSTKTRRTLDSQRSRFTHFTSGTATSATARSTSVHVVCAISENLARETCVASMDAGAPTSLHIAKQGNGQAYAETLAYLDILKPDEILLNEGRRTSQLARKIIELYCVHYAVDSTAYRYDTDKPSRRHQSRAPGSVPNQHRRSEAAPTRTIVKFVSRSCFDQTRGAVLLRSVAREDCYDPSLVEEYISLSSAHAVINYLQQTLAASFANKSLHLIINSSVANNRMAIDRSTLWQLELLANCKTGKTRNSLIGTIDMTKTTVGSRLLRTNLMAPPTRTDTIQARQELVDTFLSSEEFFFNIFEHLTRLPDIDRMLANLVLIPKVAPANSDDPPEKYVRIASKGISALISIKTVLSRLPALANAIQSHLSMIDTTTDDNEEGFCQTAGKDDTTIVTDRSSLLVGLGGGAQTCGRVVRNHLLRAIAYVLTQEELARVLHVVTDIFNETATYSRNAHTRRYQECFALKANEDGIMGVLRKTYLANVNDIYKKADEFADQYGIPVSVRYTSSRGYFLVLTASAECDLPNEFIHPIRNGRSISCTTKEVLSLNLRAQANARDLLVMTHERIQGVMDEARNHYDAIAALCDAIALLDMCHSFADNVSLNPEKWCRPAVCDESDYFESFSEMDHGGSLMIRNGTYVIAALDAEHSADANSNGYVPNDTCTAEGKRFTLITGINGSGKSIYLKQIAIIVILAHCGSYVPAEQAIIPVRDRLCTRIGNADDQEHNISTFMLEMKETAFICNSATSRSIVLLDELGRATSNEDGVAIAWALSEYLLKKRVMSFFVTHYPQLTSLSHFYPSVQNVHLEASVTLEQDGGIRYTHKAKPGPCPVTTDYGVELAASCGWPSDVVTDARNVERTVRALLPSNNVCLQGCEEDLDPSSLAYFRLLKLVGLLKAAKNNANLECLLEFRSKLICLQDVLLSETKTNLVQRMLKILGGDAQDNEPSIGDTSGSIKRYNDSESMESAVNLCQQQIEQPRMSLTRYDDPEPSERVCSDKGAFRNAASRFACNQHSVDTQFVQHRGDIIQLHSSGHAERVVLSTIGSNYEDFSDSCCSASLRQRAKTQESPTSPSNSIVSYDRETVESSSTMTSSLSEGESTCSGEI